MCLCCGDFVLPIPRCAAGKVQGQGVQMLLHPVLWLLCEPQPAVLALPTLLLIPTTFWNARKAPWGLDAAHILTATAHLCVGEE